jgi:hypothetical protein
MDKIIDTEQDENRLYNKQIIIDNNQYESIFSRTNKVFIIVLVLYLLYIVFVEPIPIYQIPSKLLIDLKHIGNAGQTIAKGIVGVSSAIILASKTSGTIIAPIITQTVKHPTVSIGLMAIVSTITLGMTSPLSIILLLIFTGKLISKVKNIWTWKWKF